MLAADTPQAHAQTTVGIDIRRIAEQYDVPQGTVGTTERESGH